MTIDVTANLPSHKRQIDSLANEGKIGWRKRSKAPASPGASKLSSAFPHARNRARLCGCQNADDSRTNAIEAARNRFAVCDAILNAQTLAIESLELRHELHVDQNRLCADQAEAISGNVAHPYNQGRLGLSTRRRARKELQAAAEAHARLLALFIEPTAVGAQ